MASLIAADAAFAPAGDVLRGITVTSDLPVVLLGGTLAAPWDRALLQARLRLSRAGIER